MKIKRVQIMNESLVFTWLELKCPINLFDLILAFFSGKGRGRSIVRLPD